MNHSESIFNKPIPPHKKPSEELVELSIAFKDRGVKMRELIEVSQGRGQLLMLIFLNIPFISPIPLPGLSTPIGIIIALLGLRVGLEQKPWLPKRLMQLELPAMFFPMLIKFAGKILKSIEYFLKPRLDFLSDRPIKFLCGVCIFISGFLLMLPLPIPMTNGFPAWSVVFLAAGMIERDGVFILSGLFVFVLTIAYFIFLWWLGVGVFDHFLELIRGWMAK